MARRKKIQRPLKNFGNFLKQARFSAGIRSQKDAVVKLSKNTYPISSSDMCRYEAGTIYDPPSDHLKALADIYQLEYAILVLQLILDKYDLRTDTYFMCFEEVIAARHASKKLTRLLENIGHGI